MKKISERIQEIIKAEGISVRAFEQRIGCSNGVIAKCLSKGSDIGSIWVSKIIETYPQYNAAWLLTGNGDPNTTREENNTHKTDKCALEMIRDLASENALLKREVEELKMMNHSKKIPLHINFMAIGLLSHN